MKTSFPFSLKPLLAIIPLAALLACSSSNNATNEAVLAPTLVRITTGDFLKGDTAHFPVGGRTKIKLGFRATKVGNSPLRSITVDVSGTPLSYYGTGPAGTRALSGDSTAITDSVVIPANGPTWPFGNAGVFPINIKVTNAGGASANLSIPAKSGEPPTLSFFGLAVGTENSDTLATTDQGNFKLQFKANQSGGVGIARIAVDYNGTPLAAYNPSPTVGVKTFSNNPSEVIDSLVLRNIGGPTSPFRTEASFNINATVTSAIGATATKRYVLVTRKPEISFTSVQNTSIKLFNPRPDKVKLVFSANKFRRTPLSQVSVKFNGTALTSFGNNGTKAINTNGNSYEDSVLFLGSAGNWPFTAAGDYPIEVTVNDQKGLSWSVSTSVSVRNAVAGPDITTFTFRNDSRFVAYTIDGNFATTPSGGLSNPTDFVFELGRARLSSELVDMLYYTNTTDGLAFTSPASAIATQVYGTSAFPTDGVENWRVRNATLFTGKLSLSNISTASVSQIVAATDPASASGITNLASNDVFGIKTRSMRALVQVVAVGPQAQGYIDFKVKYVR